MFISEVLMDVLNAVLTFSWVTYFWELYLGKRQEKVYKNNTEVPKELSSIIDNETFQKSRSYSLTKCKFGFWQGLYSQLESTLILYYGGYAYLWSVSGQITAFIGYNESYEIIQSMVFLFLGSLYGLVTGLPWSLYSTFVVEEKHGFNKMDLPFFFKDLVKKTILGMVLTLPIMALLIKIVQWGGDYFYVYAWAAVFAISMVLLHVYPEFIAPLFDRYDPLPEGELKQKIEDLAKSLDYPLKKLYVVDGSKRSSHSNAYMYGFYKNKRIVLYDTLLEDYTPVGRGDEETKEEGPKADSKKTEKKKIGCNTEEVVAVLGHELGHWYHSHMLKNLVVMQVKLITMFFLFGKLMKQSFLFEAFGFPASQQPILIRLMVVFTFVFSPFNEVEEFLMNIVSRKFEFQADEFAVNLGKRELLKTSLLKLHKDNLSFPIADWMYSARHYSHPPILERMRAMDQLKPKTE